MVKFLIKRLNKSRHNAFKNETNRNKYLLDLLKETLEDSIYTINQIQDIDAIKDKTEEEKKELRNNMINYKREMLVNKIIELDNRKIESNSQE